MINVHPGDVCSTIFRASNKPRPAVVVSMDLDHSTRPDVILALLTTQINDATDPTDYHLQDWTAAGLHDASAFRVFLATATKNRIHSLIGHLSDRDWKEVQERLRLAIAVT